MASIHYYVGEKQSPSELLDKSWLHADEDKAERRAWVCSQQPSPTQGSASYDRLMMPTFKKNCGYPSFTISNILIVRSQRFSVTLAIIWTPPLRNSKWGYLSFCFVRGSYLILVLFWGWVFFWGGGLLFFGFCRETTCLQDTTLKTTLEKSILRFPHLKDSQEQYKLNGIYHWEALCNVSDTSCQW